MNSLLKSSSRLVTTLHSAAKPSLCYECIKSVYHPSDLARVLIRNIGDRNYRW
jgi:hypothetical protein